MDTPLPLEERERLLATPQHVAFPQDVHPPGIYFDLPEDEYHADKSFSASGIKKILVSPLSYWVYSWMNPRRPPDPESAALARGKAYHCMVLEGEAAFRQRYCVAPSRADHAGVLDTVSEMRAYAADNGITVKGTAKADIAACIRRADPEVPLWHYIMEEFEQQLAGREVIEPELWEQILLGRAVINNQQSAKNCFSDGRSEVSIFWRRPEGVPMKCRIDYLNRAIVDLKSFANIQDREIRHATVFEVTRNRYQIQPAVYRNGVATMKRAYREHGDRIVRQGDFDPAWLKGVMSERSTRFFHAFIQTGNVPNFISREFSEFEDHAGNGMSPNEYWKRSEGCYAEGLRRYIECYAHYGPDTFWFTDYGLEKYRDSDFPVHFLSGSEAT